MAVLAPADWHPPRDHTMDAPSNSAIPRQRSSPANDHPSSTHPQQSLQQQHSQQSQQPYPYPVQQQQAQGAWTPSVSAQPFYPSFYQNQQHPPQPYPIHPHQPQNPYFDPTANAQLAQWAYQQMMFNAQAQAQMGPHSPITGTPQRSAPSSAPASPAEYFNPNQLFNHFPSGTPPPQQQSQHHSHHAPSYTQRTASADTGRTQYDGFHPYRRPQNTASGASGRSQGQEGDWRPAGTFQPPYARGDASASSTSVNSSNSNHGNGSGGNGGSRQRTSSIQGQSPSHSHPHVNGSASHQASVRSRSGSSPQSASPAPPPPTSADTTRVRTGSGSSSTGANAGGRPSAAAHPLPHHRTTSSSSTASSGAAATPRTSGSTSTSSTSSPSSSHSHHTTHSTTQARPVRPSPLSQGSTYVSSPTPPITSPSPRPQPHSAHTHSHAEKRMSRDDSDLAAMLESSAMGLGGTSGVKSVGLKGRLRRALSLNAAQALQEEEEQEAQGPVPKSPSGPPVNGASSSSGATPSPTDANDAASTITAGNVSGGNAAPSTSGKKKSRAASLFNSRLNASTDNISLSSTMSSASVVIRKIGSIGKLARRNSLAGITSLFKDKKDKDKDKEGGADGEGASTSGKKSKKKKDAKGSVVEPSVSHAVAELDRGSSSSSGAGGDWSEASLSGLSPAAKLARQHTLKSNAEAAAKAKANAEAQAAAQAQAQVAAQAQAQTGKGVNGAPVPTTWEKNTTTRGDGGAGQGRSVGEDGMRIVVEDDSDSGSEDGHGHGPGYSGGAQGQSYISDGWDDDEAWPEEDEDLTVRMSPGAPTGEDEEVVEWASSVRRSVERTKVPAKGILKGAENYTQEVYMADQATNPAFSRIRSNSYNSHPGSTNELGPLARIPSPDPDHIDGLHRHPSHSSSHAANAASGESGRSSPHHTPLFTLPNSSAPALSTIQTGPTALSHRAPSTTKRLVFASNLSVYDTFSSTVYDRRSEPATWSRLTPALAQRIKEELNSYKMEEMEVHACSRMHTQFFI